MRRLVCFASSHWVLAHERGSLVLLSYEVCYELLLWVDRPCFLSYSWTVRRCFSLPPTKGGYHSSLTREENSSLSVMRPTNVSLPEGNTNWPQWFKQVFTNGVPAKVSKLHIICLGGVWRRNGGGGTALSQKLSCWPNLLVLSSYMRNQVFQGPGSLTLPHNNPSPARVTCLHSPTLSPHTCLLTQFWW